MLKKTIVNIFFYKKNKHISSFKKKINMTVNSAIISKLLLDMPKLFKQRFFRSINPSGKENKIYHRYRLTGSKAMWKKDENVVYSYFTRLMGQREQIEEIISELTEEDLKTINEMFSVEIESENIFTDHYIDNETLLENLITNESYEGDNLAAEMYNNEKKHYSKMLAAEAEKEKNAPRVAEIYEAFLIAKKKNVNNKNGRGKTLRMNDLGKIYLALDDNQMLNVFGYSDTNGKAEIVEVDDLKAIKYEIDGKILYKVPNYLILSSRQADVDYALKDLSRQDAIELSVNKIKGVVSEWSKIKNLGGKTKKIQRTFKRKIVRKKIVKEDDTVVKEDDTVVKEDDTVVDVDDTVDYTLEDDDTVEEDDMVDDTVEEDDMVDDE